MPLLLKRLYRPTLGAILIFFTIQVAAQKQPDSLRQYMIGGFAHTGFVFVHTVFVESVRGTKPAGADVFFTRLHTDTATFNKVNCFPANGIKFSYVNFRNDILGSGYSLSYVLEPRWRLGNSLQAFVHGSVGLAYLTNPYDSNTNKLNQNYSTHIEAFLNLGAGFSYPIGQHFSAFAMGNFYHYSNGGFKTPNRGLNYINASVGFSYSQFNNRLPNYKRKEDFSWKKEPVHYYLSLYYSPKGGYDLNLKPERKFIIGGQFQASKKISPIDAVSLSAEAYYDDAVKSVLIAKGDDSPCTLAGLLVGHAFVLNKFTFSQQLGFYVYNHMEFYNRNNLDLFHTVYTRWGLNYQLKKHWFVGFNLLVHGHIADYVDGRVVYRFR